MIALEIFGLVEIRHGSGIYVVDSGEDHGHVRDLDVGAFELIEARMIVEGETAALAASVVTDADIDRLGQLIDAMHTGDQMRCELADQAFHEHIAKITENSALIETVENFWSMRKQSTLAVKIMTRAQGGGLEARLAEHVQIFEALKARDSHAARQAMRHHLEQVLDYLLVATETAEMDTLRKALGAKRVRSVRRANS